MKGRVGIATEGQKAGGRRAPIQINAQVLREVKASADAHGILSFTLMPDSRSIDTSSTPEGRESWREDDVKRAIAAAEQAGLRSYRVEIAPDGTIAIIVDTPSAFADPTTRD